MSTPPLQSDNRFWAVIAAPYNELLKKNHKYFSSDVVRLRIVVNVSSRDSLEDQWEPEVVNDTHTLSILCPTAVRDSDDVPCETVTLAYEESISNRFHQVSATLFLYPDDDEINASATKIQLGDVGMYVAYGTEEFTQFGIALNVIFLVLSLIAFIVFMSGIRPLLFRGWSFEQIWTVVLLLAVIFYNSLFQLCHAVMCYL